MSQVLQRKEKECGSLRGKGEDEKTLSGKLETQIKELQCRLEEIDEDLEAERQGRARWVVGLAFVGVQVCKAHYGQNLGTRGPLKLWMYRADKSRGALRRELDEINEKLEETGSNTAAQVLH